MSKWLGKHWYQEKLLFLLEKWNLVYTRRLAPKGNICELHYSLCLVSFSFSIHKKRSDFLCLTRITSTCKFGPNKCSTSLFSISHWDNSVHKLLDQNNESIIIFLNYFKKNYCRLTFWIPHLTRPIREKFKLNHYKYYFKFDIFIPPWYTVKKHLICEILFS